jgi:hypothetical protein
MVSKALIYKAFGLFFAQSSIKPFYTFYTQLVENQCALIKVNYLQTVS